MNKTIFKITAMDCLSEEQLVRMKLEPLSSVKKLVFDTPNRMLTVFHLGNVEEISSQIDSLKLNSSLISTEVEEIPLEASLTDQSEKRLLITVLLINLSLFFLEIFMGYVSNSMALVADSLDMLADVLVYGLSLFAVGSLLVRKRKIARISGYFQMILAVLGFIEVIRRFVGFEEVPTFEIMVFISILALIGNSTSLYLLQKHRTGEAHMQASWIFTANDVLVNIGVIIAGILVYATNSKFPDLIMGVITFGIVARGAYRILKL